jgi:hypothetical protein
MGKTADFMIYADMVDKGEWDKVEAEIKRDLSESYLTPVHRAMFCMELARVVTRHSPSGFERAKTIVRDFLEAANG